MGTTSRERGYYFAAPVKRGAEILGVIVVKVGVDRFETPGQLGGSKVAITDSLGVIFISSDPAWQFKTIQPLDDEALREIRTSLQYSDVTLSPLPIVDQWRAGTQAKVVTMNEEPPSEPADRLRVRLSGTREYLVQSAEMPDVGWEIHIFSNMAPVRKAVVLAVAIAVLLSVIVILTGLYLIQRRAAIREKLTAQAALQ
jgi:two-component system C4-dicarboxylate transport sensor histidine kinase DctB